MRIIGGQYRGRKIKALSGKQTRPTSDFVREALFNMLGPGISGKAFVDFYAGTGAVGIEALSRGAKSATFIESNPKACDVIKRNLDMLGLGYKSEILCCHGLLAVEKIMRNRPSFDYIFMDPPYYMGEISKLLGVLRGSNLLKPETILIAQCAHDEKIQFLGFELIKQRKYGKTLLSFLRSGET